MHPTVKPYDRLDLELYADRLARHSSRLADEIATARLRQAWQRLELDARRELGATAWAQLEALGIVSAAGDPSDEHLIERRHEQLRALSQLQELVEQRLRDIQELPR